MVHTAALTNWLGTLVCTLRHAGFGCSEIWQVSRQMEEQASGPGYCQDTLQSPSDVNIAD